MCNDYGHCVAYSAYVEEFALQIAESWACRLAVSSAPVGQRLER